MRKILVYLPNRNTDLAFEHFGARFPDAEIHPRNVRAHATGQIEPCDLCLVDDRYPYVADEYGQRGYETRVFDINELEVEPVEEDEPFRQQFASPTAYDEAIEAGLTADDLEGLEPAGKTGYTTAQIRGIVGD